jgi:hypothetical protein
MSTHFGPKTVALALLLAAAAAVGLRAQIVQDAGPVRPGYCTGGPFTLTAGQVKFHVALDDDPGAAAMTVILRLYDSTGAVVARERVQLSAGHTVTLEYAGHGLLRAQASFESLLNPSDRRAAHGSVELFDVDGFRAEIPVQCIPNENIPK